VWIAEGAQPEPITSPEEHWAASLPFGSLLKANMADCRYCNKITNGRPKVMSAGISRSGQIVKREVRQKRRSQRRKQCRCTEESNLSKRLESP